MGLEIVEIIPTVENSFGFAIPVEDAAGLNTVDKLFDYVLDHRFRGYREDCLGGIVFYKLKRAAAAVLQIPGKQIRTSTKLAEMIPSHRRRVWRELQRETGLRLPQLQRPAWIIWFASLATVAMGVAVPVILSLSFFRGAILTAILSTVVFGYLFAWLTKPLAREFYPDCTTMGQLVMLVLALNYRAIAGELNDFVSDAEVWDKLRAIVAEKTGVDPGELLSIKLRPAVLGLGS